VLSIFHHAALSKSEASVLTLASAKQAFIPALCCVDNRQGLFRSGSGRYWNRESRLSSGNIGPIECGSVPSKPSPEGVSHDQIFAFPVSKKPSERGYVGLGSK
jgi:hypothetical protein